MKEPDLIVALAKKENLTNSKATEIVNLIFDGFTDALMIGGKIEIRRFGAFSVREYGSYTGRNPNAGNNVKVKPRDCRILRWEGN